jgi:sRNA-binding carbon storage regulator CsrA
MLILTRRPGESILIEAGNTGKSGEEGGTTRSTAMTIEEGLIEITVLRTGPQVSIGIKAKKSTPIFRSEIYPYASKPSKNGNIAQGSHTSDESEDDGYY